MTDKQFLAIIKESGAAIVIYHDTKQAPAFGFSFHKVCILLDAKVTFAKFLANLKKKAAKHKWHVLSDYKIPNTRSGWFLLGNVAKNCIAEEVIAHMIEPSTILV